MLLQLYEIMLGKMGEVFKKHRNIFIPVTIFSSTAGKNNSILLISMLISHKK